MTKSINELYELLIVLNNNELRRLIRKWISNLPPQSISVIESEIYKVVYRDKAGKVKTWMDKQINKHPELTPTQLAWRFIRATGSSKRLFPWYLKMARRAKDRYRKTKKIALAL